jgi:hypothetical protein
MTTLNAFSFQALQQQLGALGAAAEGCSQCTASEMFTMYCIRDVHNVLHQRCSQCTASEMFTMYCIRDVSYESFNVMPAQYMAVVFSSNPPPCPSHTPPSVQALQQQLGALGAADDDDHTVYTLI